MKTIKSILLVAAIALSSVLSASTNPETVKDANSRVITQEVEKLLKNPSFLVDHEIKAEVTLTINKNNYVGKVTDGQREYSITGEKMK